MSGVAGHADLPFCRIAPDVKLGRDVKIFAFVNLYGCTIGDESKIGSFVEIQKNATIGSRCKISSHTFICEGVTIEDECFVGHGVVFINDRHPEAVNADGSPKTEADWKRAQAAVARRLGRERLDDLIGVLADLESLHPDAAGRAASKAES